MKLKYYLLYFDDPNTKLCRVAAYDSIVDARKRREQIWAENPRAIVTIILGGTVV